MDSSKLHALLDTQIAICENDEYLQGRLTAFLETLLPTHIENAKKSHRERTLRKERLSKECTEFTQRYLLQKSYSFSSSADLFIRYDGEHFKIYSEDDIQHEILSSISETRSLIPWKHRIKISIMRRIKDRSPLSIIPESFTIQEVISRLVPVFFPSKNAAKYFMTVIGDCLIGKNNIRVYIVHPATKQLIKEIIHYSYTYFGVSSTAFQCIKFKHHDHPYSLCRLINSNKDNDPISVPNELSRTFLDTLCVCAHYSSRYSDSDGFLAECGEDKVSDHAHFLHHNSLGSIVDNFISKKLQSCSDSEISSRNMKFLWKRFLEEMNLPNIAFYDSLHQELKNKLDYNDPSDSFASLTSPHLPLVSSFISFWDKNMTKDDDSELEISEIVTLFNENGGKLGRGPGDPATNVLELIRHFYPEITIEAGKYAIGIRCLLWNKQLEVINALEAFQTTQVSSQCEYSTNLNTVYESYSKGSKKRVISKRFFERITLEVLAENIDSDGCISPSWWKQ